MTFIIKLYQKLRYEILFEKQINLQTSMKFGLALGCDNRILIISILPFWTALVNAVQLIKKFNIIRIYKLNVMKNPI